MRRFIAFFLTPAVLALSSIAFADSDGVAEMKFSPSDIMGWDPHSFEGETRYEKVEVDGRPAVHAVCDEATASGLFYREDINLRDTPIIEWEWRVNETFSGIDETARAGDDYPARIYVVDKGRILHWGTRALTYVWASEKPVNADWPNAYARQAHMISMRSSDDAGQGWRTERRNIVEDFRRYLDHESDHINAVAIMTDCDDTGQNAEAWYGEIRFLPE